MKVAFLVSELNGVGGVASVVKVLAKRFSEDNEILIVGRNNNIPDTDYKFINWNPDGGNVFEKFIKGVNKKTRLLCGKRMSKIVEKATFPKRVLRELINIINEEHIDVIIGAAGYYSMMLGAIRSYVKTMTIGWQLNSYDAYFNTAGKYMWHKDRIYSRLVGNLDDYVVLNDYDKKKIKDELNINSTVIANIKTYESNETSDLQSKEFMAAGHLWNGKGFDLLIESFKIFAEKNNEWKLKIFGVGPDKDQLENMIREYRLDDRIFLMGNTDSTKREFLKSGCFLMPSRWEGMPMIILESLEMGVPVIAYDITAMEPLVTDGMEGFIVKKFDTNAYAKKMLEIAENDELRYEFGRNARIKARQFSKEIISEKWIELMEKHI